MLATHRDPKLRNAVEALHWARLACEATNYTNAECLDTLAAANAEAGRFNDAVKWSQRSIEILNSRSSSGSPADQAALKEVLAGAEVRLLIYRQGKAYHEG